MDACSGCALLPTKPSSDEDFGEDDSGGSLVEEIESLIRFSDAGFPIEIKEFYIWKLFAIWRETEKQIEQYHNAAMQGFIKSFFEQKR